MTSSFGPPVDWKKKAARTDRGKRKPAVPSSDDRPVYGLKTTKNFVVSNAVETILTEVKAGPAEAVRYVDKAGYGTRPEYLDGVKQEIDAEREALTEMYEEKLIEYDVVKEERARSLRNAVLCFVVCLRCVRAVGCVLRRTRCFVFAHTSVCLFLFSPRADGRRTTEGASSRPESEVGAHQRKVFDNRPGREPRAKDAEGGLGDRNG